MWLEALYKCYMPFVFASSTVYCQNCRGKLRFLSTFQTHIHTHRLSVFSLESHNNPWMECENENVVNSNLIFEVSRMAKKWWKFRGRCETISPFPSHCHPKLARTFNRRYPCTISSHHSKCAWETGIHHQTEDSFKSQSGLTAYFYCSVFSRKSKQFSRYRWAKWDKRSQRAAQSSSISIIWTLESRVLQDTWHIQPI